MERILPQVNLKKFNMKFSIYNLLLFKSIELLLFDAGKEAGDKLQYCDLQQQNFVSGLARDGGFSVLQSSDLQTVCLSDDFQHPDEKI